MARRVRLDLGLGRDAGLLFWSQLLWGAGFNLQWVLWALWAERLGASPGQIGLVLGGSAIARTALAVPAGILADRVSPKPVIVVALMMAAPGALIFALAGTWWHALIGAIVIDSSAAGLPATAALLARAATEQERTRAYTYVYNVAFGVSGIVAPAAGGWIADLVGFRTVFVVAAGLLAGGALVALRLSDTHAEQRESERQSSSQSGYRVLLAMPAVLVVLGFHFLIPFVLGIGTALQANFLHDVREMRVGLIGTFGSVNALAGLVMSLTIAHWRRMPGAFAGMAFCVALTLVSFALLLGSGALAVVGLAYALRAGFGALWPLLAATVASATPAHSRGRAYGLTELVIGVGDIGAPVTAGLLYGVDHALPLCVGMIGGLPVAAAALVAHRFRARLTLPEAAEQPVEVPVASGTA